MVAGRNSIHQHVATWGSVIGAGIALCAVIFSAGDAKQQLVSLVNSRDADDRRITTLEHDVTDMKVMLARIDQASSDTRLTVHRLERGHVYTKGGD